MTPDVTIELLGEPQGKGRPRFRQLTTKTGKAVTIAYTPAETRHYEGSLAKAAMLAMRGKGLIRGPVRVAVTAFMPIPQSWSKKQGDAALSGRIRPTTRPDWENIAKTLDAFKGIVWFDDSQVVSGNVEKYYSDTPRLLIQVSKIDVEAEYLAAFKLTA